MKNRKLKGGGGGVEGRSACVQSTSAASPTGVSSPTSEGTNSKEMTTWNTFTESPSWWGLRGLYSSLRGYDIH